MSRENVPESFGKEQGNRLKAIRMELRISPEKAAKKAGVSPQQWRKYERGEAEPKVSKLIFLEREGFSIEWLISGKGEAREGKKESIYKGDLNEWIKEQSKTDPDFWWKFSTRCAATFDDYREWLQKKETGMVSGNNTGQKVA